MLHHPPNYKMTDTRLVRPIDVETSVERPTPPGAVAGTRTEPGPAQAARHGASRLCLEAKLDLRARLGLSLWFARAATPPKTLRRRRR